MRRDRRRGSWVLAVILAVLVMPLVDAVGVTAGGRTTRARADTPVPAAAPATRPNVILFLTDDQTLADMRALPGVRRRIGAAGTTFTHAFSPYPLCCPARATLLTGQYAHNHGVLGNRAPWGGFGAFDDRETLPVWLRRAGYNTLLLGKYLNGYGQPAHRYYRPPGWTQWQVPVSGVYNYRSFTMNENGRLVKYHTDSVDHVRARGSRLIRTYAARSKPFFLAAEFVAPHSGGPVERDDPVAVGGAGALPTPGVAPEYRNAFKRLRLPAKPSFLEADMTDKPSMARPRKRPLWQYREAYQQRLESLLSVDKAVRGMLAVLDATGESRQTLVIFTSDNGFLVGEHRWFGKTVGYEESARVPLMMRGPGIVRGVRRQQLVTLADVTGTILRAAGAVATLPQDGLALQDLSADPSAAADRAILLEAGPRRSTHGNRLYTGIRTPDGHSLLRWNDGDVEYYDLAEDPYQLDGAVSGTETVEGRDALLERLATLRDCAGTTCR